MVFCSVLYLFIYYFYSVPVMPIAVNKIHNLLHLFWWLSHVQWVAHTLMDSAVIAIKVQLARIPNTVYWRWRQQYRSVLWYLWLISKLKLKDVKEHKSVTIIFGELEQMGERRDLRGKKVFSFDCWPVFHLGQQFKSSSYLKSCWVGSWLPSEA